MVDVAEEGGNVQLSSHQPRHLGITPSTTRYVYISLKMKHGLVRPGRQRWERRSEAGELARSQARCLIDRVDTVGPGAAAAVANGHYERRRLCPRREMLTSCASHRVAMP